VDYNIVPAAGVTLTVAERAALEWLATASKYEHFVGDIVVERRSDREFDLGLSGKQADMTGVTWECIDPPHFAENGRGCRMRQVPCEPGTVRSSFRSWLPLACLHVWWGDPKWGRYVDDQGTGDWSFVRDQSYEEAWAMFYNVVNAARGI
jgi:hypothetical protein